jgi:hypothetical protein
MTENDGRQAWIGWRVGATDLGYGLVELVFCEKDHLVDGPPAANARPGPILSVKVQGAQPPAGLATTAVIGYDHSLIRKPVAFLGWSVARQFDGKCVIVL